MPLCTALRRCCWVGCWHFCCATCKSCHSCRALGDRGLAAFPELFTPARELPSPAQLAVARRIAGMVDLAAARGPWRATCLVRSLVLARFLRARGIPCQLEMGSRLDGDGDARFSARAWVRCGDAVDNEGGANTRRYQAFQRREP